MVIDTESDRLLERKNPAKNESEKYTYDAVGNMIRREVVNATTGTKNRQIEYRYNYQDQLTSVSQNGQLVAEYGYDTNRQRVYAKTYVSPYKSEKYYTWSGGQIIAESDTQGGENIVRYIYSGNQKVAMIRKDKSGTEQVYYFVNNGQGTPVMIVNESGAVVSRITVDEWGNPSPVEYGSMNEVNYTGKKYDPATGLYYFNQRYYDPRIGRFLTEDPAGQAFNPYLYAANNPLMYVDPDGEFFFEIFAAVFGTVNGLVEGIKVSQDGGDFGRGFARGWIDGVKVGGTVGLVADIATGWGLSTYNGANLFFKMMASSYLAAWQGQAGASFSGGFGGGSGGAGSGRAVGGGTTKGGYYYENPGTCLPGSGPGMGVAPGTGDVESAYKWRNGKMHTGVDFRFGDGIVRARFSGTVAYVGTVRGDGYGLRVIIAHDLGFNSQSSHLERSLVSVGAHVYAGDPIANIGNSGGPYKAHLHYEEFTGPIFGVHHFFDPGYREKKW